MPKVFLSHSSKDKESYVSIVAEKLIKHIGEESVILDEISFQPGRRTIEEIERGLNETDLFVIFLSQSSLSSEWVKKELFKANVLWKKEKLIQICPIIIDEAIKYDNPLIPEWLKENYNLRYISRPTKAEQIINQRMIELSFEKHPRLKERKEIFVGRNNLISRFEERMDDFEKGKPVCVVATGIHSIGRKTLLKHCIFKCNITKDSYPFPMINLSYAESIEDFILKISGLGFSKEIVLNGLMKKTLDEKIDIIAKMLCAIQTSSDIVFVEDNGSIINQDGEIAEWFTKMLEYDQVKDKFAFCLVSKYKLRKYPDNITYLTKNKITTLEVEELNKKERTGLLGRYLEFENIELAKDDMRLVSELLTGFPEQVFYSVEIIKEKGIQYLRNDPHLIVEFNSKKASFLIQDIENDDEKLSMLALLCKFDYVGLQFISEIVGGEQKFLNYIEEFILKSICEYVGVLKEYIRVNETIKDYVVRNNYSLLDLHKANLDRNLKEFLKNVSQVDYDVPEYLFFLKEALIKGQKLEDRVLIPSLYLKTMTELYNNSKNKEVITFADKVLENEQFMDPRLTFEVRYLLCSALAKLKDNRFAEEVRKIHGANHDFLYGFYYRQVGRFDKALERINKSLEQKANFSKAKREKVQILIGMQEYQAARDLAKENYSNYKDNPYHIQAYFSCVIKSDKNGENRKILDELIDSLSNIKSDVAKEMTLRCRAQLSAFYDDDEETSLALISDAIDINPNIQYARIVKFDICERFGLLGEMKKILHFFEQEEYKNRYQTNIVIFKAVIMAKEGKPKQAIQFFKERIRYFTEDAKEKFAAKLERLGLHYN